MPGLALAGRIVSRFGNLHGLRIGALSSCVSFALAGRARTWLDFSAAAVCGSFAMTSYSSQSALAMIEGKAVGFQQGELQAAIGSLSTVCSVLAPNIWSWLYELGSKRDRPGAFYYGLATVQLLKLALSYCVGLDDDARPKDSS